MRPATEARPVGEGVPLSPDTDAVRPEGRPLATAAQRCPTCHRPWDPGKHAGRVCADCGGQILRGHKYEFLEDGKVHHRHCDRPGDYK